MARRDASLRWDWALWGFGMVGALALGGCRLDPECFGQNDCLNGFVCFRGTCTQPDASTDAGGTDGAIDAGVDAGTVDFGVPVDLGFPDTGPPDLGPPDAQRPDLGTPDAGLGDAGFITGPMPGGTNPLVGTSTPTSLLGGFRDLQNITLRTSTNTLLISDVLGETVYEFDPARPTMLRVLETPSGRAAGITSHPVTQDLVVCEQAGQRLRVKPRGGGVDLVLVADYLQHRLNSPNDVAIRSDGVIYFTDPPFGLDGRPQDIPFNGLYRFQPLTSAYAVEWMGVPGVHAPDGLALSPDETRLYLSEVNARVVLVFDVGPNGGLFNRRGFAQTRGLAPNGLAVDDDGNVYVSTSLGIEVYAPNGFYWGFIALPGPVSDLTFGPPNRQRIFATTTSTVYAIDVPIPGPAR